MLSYNAKSKNVELIEEWNGGYQGCGNEGGNGEQLIREYEVSDEWEGQVLSFIAQLSGVNNNVLHVTK